MLSVIRGLVRPPALASALLLLVLLAQGAVASLAQGSSAAGLAVDMAPLEGVELTPAAAFNYSIVNSGGARDVRVTATLRFRNSALRLSCAYNARLEPGINAMSRERAGSPAWTSSDPALRALFQTYGRLPQGTYEYCVTAGPGPQGGESGSADAAEGCTYHTVEDLFAINLIDPEDGARLYERYPVFSWAVNYPFASELSYRIRVAEQKAGQNPANAIARNNAVWQQTGLPATTATYPLAGRPLEVGQPYVWTVDAYYHGLLIGGSESWRFIIVEDSLNEAVTIQQSYYDFENHKGDSRLYTASELKLFYQSERGGDSLHYELLGKEDAVLEKGMMALKTGQNYLRVPLAARLALVHGRRYQIGLQTTDGKSFKVPFVYINPDFLKP